MDVFDLVAKLTLDDSDYNDKIGKGKNAAKAFGESFKKGIGTAAKVAGAAVAAASAAVISLTKQSVAAYAEYEQLVGGAQKIFDKMDYSQIAADAAQAYETMNISAAQYLEMINSVGATFSQTMGDQKGYETAKAGMQAIADYASGTGKDVNELNQKFAMITRSTSSYQSIADQFSGILPATSADFLKQAQAAGFLSKKYKQLTQVPVAEYQQAVSKMLEKGVADLGLAGNTAMETANTISGSLNAMKASWQNLLTGLSDPNADLDTLIDRFIKSADTFGKNVLPTVKKSLNGITKLVTQGIQKLSPIIVDVVKENLPDIIKAGVSLLTALIAGLIAAIPELVDALPEIFSAIKTAFEENAPALKEAGIQLLIYIAQGIAAGLSWIGEQMVALGNAIKSWLGEAWDNVKTAAGEKWQQISQTVSDAVQTIREKFDEWVSAAREKVEEFKQAIHDKMTEIVTEIGQWIEENIITPARDKIAEFVDIGSQIVDKIREGISNAWGSLTSWFNGIWDSLFGNRNVNVNVTKTGGYAIGLDYVPFNGFPAMLHRGEAVLTAREADEWRRGNSGKGNVTTINQYIETVPQTPVELAAATAAYFEQARWAVA